MSCDLYHKQVNRQKMQNLFYFFAANEFWKASSSILDDTFSINEQYFSLKSNFPVIAVDF